MGTISIHLGDNHFWVHPDYHAVVMRLAALHIEDPEDEFSLAAEIRDNWLLAGRDYLGSSGTLLNLAANVKHPAGRRVVIGALESLLRALRKHEFKLDAHAINLLGIDGDAWPSGSGIEVPRLIAIAEAMLALVNGEPCNGRMVGAG